MQYGREVCERTCVGGSYKCTCSNLCQVSTRLLGKSQRDSQRHRQACLAPADAPSRELGPSTLAACVRMLLGRLQCHSLLLMTTCDACSDNE